jgi:PD-(D/E)XK endonuclease
VLRPIVEGRRYDLVFDTGPRLLRVQCKWAARKGSIIVVHTRTCRWTSRGYVRSTYSPIEIDAVAAYCPDLERFYLLPIEDVGSRSMVHLRLARAANNQEAAIKYAATYEFAGAIAQLGERVTGSHEVGGSNPPSSTSQGPSVRAASPRP